MITREQVLQALDEVDSARDRAIDLQKRFAQQECPYKIGDKAVINDFSHAGKEIVIDWVGRPRSSMRGDWEAKGYILKNDGSVGKKRGSVYHKGYRDFTL